ncbi:MAG: hypothetical protein ACREC9_15865 [Methylocella sp.]
MGDDKQRRQNGFLPDFRDAIKAARGPHARGENAKLNLAKSSDSNDKGFCWKRLARRLGDWRAAFRRRCAREAMIAVDGRGGAGIDVGPLLPRQGLDLRVVTPPNHAAIAGPVPRRVRAREAE